MVLTAHAATNRVRQHLAELGFTRPRNGDGYRLNGTLFTTDGFWSALRSAQAVKAEPLQGQLSKPGLWKHVTGPNGRGVFRHFDLPPIADEPEERADDEARVESCLSWALATAHGEPPPGWTPPPRHEVEAWLPVGGLTVQAGPLVRQGELVYRPDRLALTLPILPRVPDDLPASRRAWLHELLTDGQDHWRMVRVGLTEGAGPVAAVAEVDLTGCPRALLESVFVAGLGALRWVVEWLVRSAAFLADPALACRALEVCTVRV